MNRGTKIGICLGVVLAVVGGSAAAARAERLYEDDFTTARGRYELLGGNVWQIKGGQCRFVAPGYECFAVVNLDELQRAQIRATLTIHRRLGTSFDTAGLTLLADHENHWRLLLVAAPDGHTYFELLERYQGQHQAQNGTRSGPTRLDSTREGTLKSWQYNTPYELSLSITPEAIVGQVRDPATKEFWRTSYAWAAGRAVRQGRPGLAAAGLEGRFTRFAVDGSPGAVGKALAIASGRAGSVAIVRDQGGRMTEGLRTILVQAGFGVTVLGWEEVAHGRLPAESLDVLLLADARRLPGTLIRPIMRFLRSRGKLIALGAPAFRELLVATPRGYVDVERYGETVYDLLSKRRMALRANAWRHAALYGDRQARIERPPVEEPGWQVSCDLDGWDTFAQSIEDEFAGGRTLLCFRAWGDAKTPQLAIECVERDGSRWVASVALSTTIRSYVLRSSDFSYWPDSPAHRGGSGDHFQPANVARLVVGLSSSHTPQCKPGPHTYWFGNLATAADPNIEEPNVQLPELESLCPSYTLYPLAETATLRPAHAMLAAPSPPVAFRAEGYSPVWREGGIGFDRGRPWRWVRVLDACDAQGRDRGSLVSLMLGESVLPGAMWANVGLADPAVLLAATPGSACLRTTLVDLAQAMVRGVFLLEGGSRQFSYEPGEKVELGALVYNGSRKPQSLGVEVVVNDLAGKTRFARRLPVQIAAGERGEVRCQWTPPADAKDVFPATVSTRLLAAGSATPAREVPLDSISHRIELLPDEPASPQEFVSVSGSHFRLGGKPWYMRGVNYRPDNQGGLPPLDMLQRDRYDPEIIERDLEWMQSAGINMLSAIHASQPLDPDAPAAYRDTQDFLNRCRRHGMKVFYFLPWGNPLNKPDVAAIKKHIAAAGLKEHPAILAWELAWEPIHVPGAARHGMPDLVPDWNAWIVERYGSLAEAEHDWGFSLKRLAEAPPKPARSKAGLAVPMRKARPPAPRVGPPAGRVELVDLPEARWCASHGPWDRAVAAFRRFFSDHIGRGYGDIIRELSDFDPQHLVTFRFGACGIPDKVRFADAHSAAVAKHVSFLCPEGYNLQPGGPAQLSPADDIRQGGLVTLYYRFLSREKPVVWMEFGYSVNGMNTSWKPGLEHIRPSELDHQRTEFAHFYQMFLESGARGAAPWWLPGGFRLGENSDFGILEPDGSPRPACQVLRESLPKFAAVGDASCVAGGEAQSHTATQVITLDLDAHYADAWDFYAPQYLAAVKAGRRPLLRTAGTGSTSADCPLLAVGDTPCTGRNPPAHLNAEFDQVEVQESPSAAWRYVGRDQVITVGRGAKVRCRARIGNTAEATWLAPRPDGPETGAVYLGCQSQGAATQLRVPITESTPYLGDADTAEFELPLPGPGQERVTLQMRTARASAGHVLPIPFGEKWSFTIKVLP